MKLMLMSLATILGSTLISTVGLGESKYSEEMQNTYPYGSGTPGMNPHYLKASRDLIEKKQQKNNFNLEEALMNSEKTKRAKEFSFELKVSKQLPLKKIATLQYPSSLDLYSTANFAIPTLGVCSLIQTVSTSNKKSLIIGAGSTWKTGDSPKSYLISEDNKSGPIDLLMSHKDHQEFYHINNLGMKALKNDNSNYQYDKHILRLSFKSETGNQFHLSCDRGEAKVNSMDLKKIQEGFKKYGMEFIFNHSEKASSQDEPNTEYISQQEQVPGNA